MDYKDKIVSMDEVKKLKKKIDQEDDAKLDFHLNDNNKIKANSLYNIELILENDPELQGLFKYNDFTSEIDVVKASDKLLIKPGQLKDAYLDEIDAYIEKSSEYDHVLFKMPLLRSAVVIVANHHHYNPVKDYMEQAGKNWDGQHRLDTFFNDYLGVDQTPITRLITRLWFIGAVVKVFEPTTKFDFVLDLVGGQGAGKTTILQKLAPKGYYTDQFADFESKDSFAVMRRALIVNDDEMTATANSSFETLKKFVTLQEFEYRKPYGHEAERFPKGFVIARTTNNLYYLKDKTGERRFLPLLVNRAKQKANPVRDLTPHYVEQLWGEAMHVYKSGEYDFTLTSEQEAKLDKYRESFMYTDVLEDTIADCMENEWKDRDFLSNDDISLKIAPGVSLTKNRRLSNKIMNIMVNQFGWVKGQKKINGENHRGYVKKVTH